MAKLTMLFVDAATENVDAIPRRLRDLGVRYDATREQEFRGELQVLFDRYYGSRLSDIDPLQVIREGFQLIYSMNLKLPSRFVILDKAIATLASVGQEVYPEFNVFEIAKPYARVSSRTGSIPARCHSVRASRRSGSRRCSDMPYQVSDVLEHAAPGHVPGAHREPGHRRDRRPHRQGDEPHRGRTRLLGGLLGSAMIGVFAKDGPHALGIHFIALVGFIISGVFGFWLVGASCATGGSELRLRATCPLRNAFSDLPEWTSGTSDLPG
jgi:ubiquinone biosynthesis protein